MLAAFTLTGAKGAAVSACAAAVIVAVVRGRGLWRWLSFAGACCCLGIAVLVPQVAALGQASVDVRLEYWSITWRIIETAPFAGHGIGDLRMLSAGLSPAVQLGSAEPHNAVLAAWAAGGVLSALAVSALLACLVWPRRQPLGHHPSPNNHHSQHTAPDPITTDNGGAALHLGVVASLPLGMVLLIAAGALVSDNIGLYPGGGTLVGQVMWAVLLAVIGCGAAWAVSTLALPSHRWFGFATATIALGSLIDFHMADPAVLGCLVVSATLASVHTARAHPSDSLTATEHTLNHSNGIFRRIIPMIGAVIVLGATAWGIHRWQLLREADVGIELARNDRQTELRYWTNSETPDGQAGNSERAYEQLAAWTLAWPTSTARLVAVARLHPNPDRALFLRHPVGSSRHLASRCSQLGCPRRTTRCSGEI